MNVAIADILRSELEGLNFVDQLGGLVKVIQIKQSDKKIRRVPSDYSVTQHQINRNNYQSYMPDGKKMSVIYFEDGGITLESHQARYINLISSLKLVAWFNLERINRNLNTGTTLLLRIMDRIPNSFPNQSNILKARVVFQGQDPKTPDIFAAYDYDETEIQHLMYPYDYGALNYNILFSVRPECLNDILIRPVDCLTDPNCV